MATSRNVKKVNNKSIQRAGLWFPSNCSAMEKILLGLASVLIVAGTFAAVIVPLTISLSKVAEETSTTTIIQTTITDTTTTTTTSTASTSTTTSSSLTTSSTSTSTSVAPRLPISLNATVTASNFDLNTGSVTSQSDSLVDRTVGGSGLNTGGYPPQYVQLEFPGLYNISSIYLQIGQAPNGVTRHQLNAGSNLSALSLVMDMNNYTSAGQWINLTYSPALNNVRYLRLNTTSGPSWVAWVKFIVYDQ